MLLRSRGASVLLSSHDFSGHRGMKWPSSRCKKIGMVLRGFRDFDACDPWRWYPAQALVTTLVTEVCVAEGGFNTTRGLVQSLTRRSGLSWAGGCGCCRHEWLLQAGATKERSCSQMNRRAEAPEPNYIVGVVGLMACLRPLCGSILLGHTCLLQVIIASRWARCCQSSWERKTICFSGGTENTTAWVIYQKGRMHRMALTTRQATQQ